MWEGLINKPPCGIIWQGSTEVSQTACSILIPPFDLVNLPKEKEIALIIKGYIQQEQSRWVLSESLRSDHTLKTYVSLDFSPLTYPGQSLTKSCQFNSGINPLSLYTVDP